MNSTTATVAPAKDTTNSPAGATSSERPASSISAGAPRVTSVSITERLERIERERKEALAELATIRAQEEADAKAASEEKARRRLEDLKGRIAQMQKDFEVSSVIELLNQIADTHGLAMRPFHRPTPPRKTTAPKASAKVAVLPSAAKRKEGYKGNRMSEAEVNRLQAEMVRLHREGSPGPDASRLCKEFKISRQTVYAYWAKLKARHFRVAA